MNAAIDRILHRHMILRNGTAEPTGGQASGQTSGQTGGAAFELTWDVSFPADPEAEDADVLSFPCTFTVVEERVTAIHCGSPVDRYPPDQASVVSELVDDLAESLEREGVRFTSFEALVAYLVKAGGTETEGSVEVPSGADSTFVTVVPVEHEPWVSLSIPFDEDADPEWLLEKNGDLTHVHFEAFEGGVSLSTAFPLALLTAERLLELIEDLGSLRERLLDELDGGDEEDDQG